MIIPKTRKDSNKIPTDLSSLCNCQYTVENLSTFNESKNKHCWKIKNNLNANILIIFFSMKHKECGILFSPLQAVWGTFTKLEEKSGKTTYEICNTSMVQTMHSDHASFMPSRKLGTKSTVLETEANTGNRWIHFKGTQACTFWVLVFFISLKVYWT